MKRLVLILISFAAGCAQSRAVNPYAIGTREYEQWRDDHSLRQARRSFLFDGHEGDAILNESSPSSSFRRQHRDR
jgi:hypothetical protein